ncbi:hypothetical protein RND81_03G204000 [Saponaria officinalis]|uniref:Uncharacterized protein n=1 Tax=Saponaria officinalis TaxID=3572 RepID=A0AAW1M7U8_SAPOF
MEDSSMVTETSQLSQLIHSLEQATHMAKQLRSTSTADHHRHRIFSALNSANLSLSAFLSLHNSADIDGDGESMMIADDGGEEEEMMSKMREFLYIQNKRPKRPLSPSAAAAAERWSMEERESARVPVAAFGSLEEKMKNFDLVYQFHA